MGYYNIQSDSGYMNSTVCQYFPISTQGSYTLPVATASILGGVIIGDNITVATNGTISVEFPVTSVNEQTGDVVLTASDVGALASGDNISELTNDSGYLTSSADMFDYLTVSGATLTLYVDGTDGSDSNNGLTSDTAFATISKALAVPDSRFKDIYVSGTLTESVNVNGANARITFISGTMDLTISRTNNIYCNLALVNSTATVTLAFSGSWIAGNLIISGASGYEITVNMLPNIQNGSIYVGNSNVTLSSSLSIRNSNFYISNSNFTMGGNSFNPISSNYTIANSTFTGCGTYLFNICRCLSASLGTVTHDATYLLRGTAMINYTTVTGSVATDTYNTSLIV